MLNLKKWFTNNYKNYETFRLNYKELLNSSYLTSQNLDDFNNPNYLLTNLDIFKYITVLEYLFKNNEQSLAYYLNPYLINKFNKNNYLFPYNEALEVNIYKNIIVDLYFLDIPIHVYNLIPLSVLLGEINNDNEIEELSELEKLNLQDNNF